MSASFSNPFKTPSTIEPLSAACWRAFLTLTSFVISDAEFNKIALAAVGLLWAVSYSPVSIRFLYESAFIWSPSAPYIKSISPF